MRGREKGFKAFIWVNKLIDGLIDVKNKSPTICLIRRARKNMSGAISYVDQANPTYCLYMYDHDSTHISV